MDTAAHWETIFASKAPDAVSWYRPHLETSLALIARYTPAKSASIIDVGAGESTLVDDLLAAGYQAITVLDVSKTAVEATRRRIGDGGRTVQWIVGDVTGVSLPPQAFDVWHDRAVFHFLTGEEERRAYVRSVIHALKPGGHAIVSTFGPQGPLQCSGLDVVRYDAKSLHYEFGRRFRIEESSEELHRTPWGAVQQFVYCCCRVD